MELICGACYNKNGQMTITKGFAVFKPHKYFYNFLKEQDKMCYTKGSIVEMTRVQVSCLNLMGRLTRRKQHRRVAPA